MIAMPTEAPKGSSSRRVAGGVVANVGCRLVLRRSPELQTAALARPSEAPAETEHRGSDQAGLALSPGKAEKRDLTFGAPILARICKSIPRQG